MGAGRGRRTGMILIILILIVVIIGVGGVFLLRTLGGGAAPSEQQLPPTVPPTPTPMIINVIVAARDIPRGAQLTMQDVTIIPWPDIPEARPPIGTLVVRAEPGAAGLEQVEGRIARVDILNGQPIMDFMLTPGGQPTNLADMGSDVALMIPSGMVAVAFPVTRLSSVAYALRPGDHVDILMSFRFVDVDEDFQSMLPNSTIVLTDDPELAALGLQNLEFPYGREEVGVFGTSVLIVPSLVPGQEDIRQIARQTTQLVIDNAIVLRLGDWPVEDMYQPIVITPSVPTPTPEITPGAEQQQAPPAGTPTPVAGVPVPDVITLAMTRQDALVLKYASEVGASIELALRSALDDDINDIVTDPVTLNYIITTRNVTPPERLPIALDPRVDALNLLSMLSGTAEATPQP